MYKASNIYQHTHEDSVRFVSIYIRLRSLGFEKRLVLAKKNTQLVQGLIFRSIVHDTIANVQYFLLFTIVKCRESYCLIAVQLSRSTELLLEAK